MTDVISTIASKKTQHAAYMREYSRKRGAVPVKGVIINCTRCGATTEKQHRSHNLCAQCVAPSSAERKRQKRAARGTVSIGAVQTCKNCGCSFEKIHKRQFYCAGCSNLASTGKMEKYRVWANAYQSKRNKHRRKSDPAFAIRCRITAAINNSLRDGKNGKSWEVIVGYKLIDLMSHLERQFLPGMTWENRSQWHIDHIIPVSAFVFDSAESPEFRAAWALTNLRPLWGAENVRKSDKRIFLI